MNESHIFIHALKLATPVERAAYLKEACAGDRELRVGVEALLLAHETDPGFLEQPAAYDTTRGLPPPPDSPTGRGPDTDVRRPGVILTGRYELVALLGQGGMGSVWAAQQHEPLKRMVAVKVIKSGMDSKAVLARFEVERQALALMDHPSIARVLDAGTDPDGRPFFVMELVEGVPINHYCDERRLTLRQRLSLFVTVCRAVQHAHQKGIIHRDIKPSNVLVTEGDGPPVPKVIDFGIAKATGEPLTEYSLHTGVGTVLGTPDYMSPEQASLNTPDVDTRSDVYSLGVLLYELLVGSPPLSRTDSPKANLLEVLRIIREEEPPRPSTKLGLCARLPALATNRSTEPARLVGLVRGELDWIAMKALEKDRDRRYETAAAFAADVQRYLADEPVQACPPSIRYRLRKFVRRNKRAVLTAGAVLVVLAGGIVGTAWQAVSANRERELAVDERNAKHAALEQARLLSAEYAFDKGQLLGERGDADLAVLWLARSLRLAPPDAADLQAAIRAGLGAWQSQLGSVRLAVLNDGWAWAVGFAPHGQLLTAGWKPESSTVTVQRWDPVTGRTSSLMTIPAATQVEAISFSPKADHLLLGFKDGSVQLHGLVADKVVWRTGPSPDRQAVSATFSPDGKMVLIGFSVGVDRGNPQLFDVDSGQPLGREMVHERPVYAAGFAHDGKSFVTGCGIWGNVTERVEVRFWDLEGCELRPPLEHGCMAPAVALSPDGTQLLTGHWDFKARLWDLAAQREPVVLTHDGPIIRAAFSPDGETILTGSLDGAVCIWDRTGHLLIPPLRHSGLVQAAGFGPGGKTVLVGVRASNSTRLWDLSALDSVKPVEPRSGVWFPLAVSPDHQTILTRPRSTPPGDANHVFQLRDTTTGQDVGAPLRHRDPVRLTGSSVPGGEPHACSSDRRRALTVDGKNVARLWDTLTGTAVAELRPDPAEAEQPIFFAAAFSPDGRFVVTGHFDATARVWEAGTGRLLPRQLKHDPHGPVFTVAFSPDGRTLATGGADGVARFWDTTTWEQVGPALRQGKEIFSLAYAPDGTTLITGGSDVNGQLWDVAARGRRSLLSGHHSGVHAVAFSPNGCLALTGSRDKTARLWNVATGKPVGPPMKHPTPVVRVAFAGDGKSVLTACEDGLAHVWPVPSALAGTPEQVELWTQVATGMELEADGQVRVLDSQDWQERAKS